MKLPDFHPFRTGMTLFVLVVGAILLYLEIVQQFR